MFPKQRLLALLSHRMKTYNTIQHNTKLFLLSNFNNNNWRRVSRDGNRDYLSSKWKFRTVRHVGCSRMYYLNLQRFIHAFEATVAHVKILMIHTLCPTIACLHRQSCKQEYPLEWQQGWVGHRDVQEDSLTKQYIPGQTSGEYTDSIQGGLKGIVHPQMQNSLSTYSPLCQCRGWWSAWVQRTLSGVTGVAAISNTINVNGDHFFFTHGSQPLKALIPWRISVVAAVQAGLGSRNQTGAPWIMH